MKKICPDEETLACFVDGILAGKELKEFNVHLEKCNCCREIIELTQAVLRENSQALDVPENLLRRVKSLIGRTQRIKGNAKD